MMNTNKHNQMATYYYARLELAQSKWERRAILNLINLCQWSF
ncbi:hypothetical protein [Vibrio sp. Of14-4]|nr:hypothetical protein [Vibrio sp. Of14-4]